MNDIIKEVIDLTHLQFEKQRNSSVAVGTFLKGYDIENGKKVYYKMSQFNDIEGVIGHECINELISSRLLDILGINHLSYTLINARVIVNSKEYNTYITKSFDFKNNKDKKIALDTYYELNRYDGETPFEFIDRLGFKKYVYDMFVFDFIIGNRDRHGANIEVLKTNKQIKLAPLFDHGLSLLFSKLTKEEIVNANVLEDYKVQSFLGTNSLYKNVDLIPKEYLLDIPKYDEKYLDIIFDGIDMLPDYHIEKIKEMIRKRWLYYENIRNTR